MATLKKGGGKTRVCYFYDSDVRTAAARFQRLSRDFFRALARAICLMIKCVRRSSPQIGNYYYGQGHPMKPHRIRMAHNLLLSYGLYRKMEIYVRRRRRQLPACLPLALPLWPPPRRLPAPLLISISPYFALPTATRRRDL